MTDKEEKQKPAIFKKWWFWLVAGVIAGVVGIMAIALTVDERGGTEDDDASISEYTDPGEVEAEYLEDKSTWVAQLSDSLMMGVSSEYVRPYEYKTLKPEIGKEFVALVVVFRNFASERKEETYSNSFCLYDKSDKCIAISNVSLYSNDSELPSGGVLNAGETVSGYVVFEIDKTQKISDLSLVYTGPHDENYNRYYPRVKIDLLP